MARVQATTSGIHIDQRHRMELKVTRKGQQVTLTSTSGGPSRPAVLTISASNPNAASAKDINSAVFGNAAVGGRGDTTSDMAAFLREGRLYVVIHSVTDSTGHAGGHVATERLTMDIVAMLERIE
jgi:hypothetical protein